MIKSFRNLILSLFLAVAAAGLAACEGERGPAGEAGPAGAAGTDGAKGATGDPGEAGKDLDDLPRPYEFIKVWGKPDGMAACSDDIFRKTEAFPGPAALAKIADGERVPVLTGAIPRFPSVSYGSSKGQCSNEVFPDNAPFGFGASGTFLRSEKMKETPKRGKTAVLDNPTLTTTEKQFWGGVLVIDLKGNAPEVEGMDTLVTRCGVGKRPFFAGAPAVAGSKRIEGEYRIALTTETENILGKDAGGSTVIKDSDPNTAANDYELINYTTQVCIKLDSVPGTVKCYVRMSVQERNAADDTKTAKRNVTERMAVYKDGKLTPVMPVSYSNGLLAGTSFIRIFPFGPSGSGGNLLPAKAPAAANLDSFGKLCNFFGNGVVPCPDGEVPNERGVCG